MPDETMDQALPPIESAAILGGPDDAIWDNIFDWIQDAIAVITRVVTDWIYWLYSNVYQVITSWVTWLWDNVVAWFRWLRDLISSTWSLVWDWISSRLSDLWTWISGSFASLISTVGAWFTQTWAWLTDLWDRLGDIVAEIGQMISSMVLDLYAQLSAELSSSLAWLAETVTERLDLLIDQVKALIPEWILAPGKWIGQLLDGVVDWLLEDIPGHSPRWLDLVKSFLVHFPPLFFAYSAIQVLQPEAPLDFLKKWLFDFPLWFIEDIPERAAYGLATSFQWVSDTLNPIVETFNDSILSFAKRLGPISPDTAASGFSSIAKVGFAALAGLTAMTVAGELLHPLKRIGLGNLAAVIYDMTNYKLITGAFIGTLTYSMLQTPLRYYFNSLFRPMVLREREFTELLSRRAFTDPDTLQNPELSAAVRRLAPGGGPDFEAKLVSYFGYPGEYLGLFKELANTRLGYFALAGIARTGFWDKAWFLEALARTGYSETARGALMIMMEELVTSARQGPVLGLVRRNVREGYFDMEDVKAALDKVAVMPALADIRLYAVELETDYEERSIALDINLRAFSRGVIREAECRENLAGFIKRESMIDYNLDREKLGLIRRLTWSPPELEVPFQIVEE